MCNLHFYLYICGHTNTTTIDICEVDHCDDFNWSRILKQKQCTLCESGEREIDAVKLVDEEGNLKDEPEFFKAYFGAKEEQKVDIGLEDEVNNEGYGDGSMSPRGLNSTA
ncbi:hypothetical protein CC78DRAFT_542653 [Lojkania enalia]|uniref:Uncharacterized protein n=1 Tax=Lojkania enalia TaxID=147567 RepID=A0A9P4N1J2_9PLEO|nr:hypothetical protein CC78DRAFT_542653 [Didymosphaeria enalia]